MRKQIAFRFSCDSCHLDACNDLLNYIKLQGEEKDKDGNIPLFSLVLTMMQSEYLPNCINSITTIKKLSINFQKRYIIIQMMVAIF